jgi:hypothetical protein
MTLSINGTQHNWPLSITMISIMLSVVMINVTSIYCNAECRYAECHNAICRYAECRCAERRYAESRGALPAKDDTAYFARAVIYKRKMFIKSTADRPVQVSVLQNFFLHQ